MPTVRSTDGTTIAYEFAGHGPAVVLVDGAMCYRASGPMRPLAAALHNDFTVYAYDRRGRGDSGDAAAYSPEREIEDLDALLAAAGGAAGVYAISSGVALAVAAAAAGAPIRALALYEPPFLTETGGGPAKARYTDELTELLAAGRNGDAAALFMNYIGMPADTVAGLRTQPFWPTFEAIAPTLAYDDEIMGDGTVPAGIAAKISVPTLVLDGGASPDNLRGAARALADAVPGARHATLSGQTHDVAVPALAPVLVEFFATAL
jgi:pimeloyl-ACP methyl ester carboxylesterase